MAMRIRVTLAVFALSLAVVTVTLARQQPGVPAKQNQDERDGQAHAGLQTAAALRSQVAKLRAQVELMEIEHEVDRTLLFEALKAQGLDPAGKLAAEGKEQASQMTLMAASMGKLTDFKKKFGDDKAIQSQIEKEAQELAEVHRTANARKKEAFLRQTTELNEKRLALAELEKQLLNPR
jgi:hypothetical protein